MPYTIGLDFGSDSVRAIIANTANGEEVAASVFYYPRWAQGLYCDPENSQFRQHPLDFIEGIEATIKDCVAQAGPDIASQVVGISVDSTGSTPILVDENGTPLSLLEGLEENPNAMFVLWKDHTSIKEAEEFNEKTKNASTNYLKYVGGIYSSEWFWAKLLHVLREDETVRTKAHSIVENCDWVPFILAGGTSMADLKRGVCSAGHKGLWAQEWGGFPPNDYFVSIDPLLDGYVETLKNPILAADKSVGTLSKEWADKLGLPETVVIGIGAFDCHMGAVGGQIEPFYVSKVIGTSTCDIVVAPYEACKDIVVEGICGQVDGSVIPGMIGMEAGQSAFGDAYAWFAKIISWPIDQLIKENADNKDLVDLFKKKKSSLIPELTKAAEKIIVTEKTESAIDWFNGRRTPDADQTLKGVIAGLNLGTDAPRIFRAIVEATCFGARAIVERFIEQGVPIKGIIGLGGIAQKSPFVMQTMADVINMPIKVHISEQTCALGAAMFAATAAGVFQNVNEAMDAMGTGFLKTYEPNTDKVSLFEKRYQAYKKAADFYGQKA
ncbi:MAG: ribulokinase [Pseudopedobacter saltans]|uniref:Ribulokinase n=1 Tax=Pseudopedobacter saltans TaxID=151895 RepID=A0A2W5EUK4_9SPHI|nr:MAG: ribulokinase [Pseudopedobacter saltans]